MSAKIMAAPLPHFAEAPLARFLRNAVRWVVQHVSPAAGSTERALAVEERIAIGPKKSLVLVRCQGRQFLVATAGDTVGPILEIGQIAPPRAKTRRTRGGNQA